MGMYGHYSKTRNQIYVHGTGIRYSVLKGFLGKAIWITLIPFAVIFPALVERTNYFQQGVSKSDAKTDYRFGGMKKSTNSKYCSLYFTGNNMTVGLI